MSFATSFLVARISGAHALGEYSTLLNTATSIIQPFVQVMHNNSTMLAVDARRGGAVTVRRAALANLLLAAVLSIVSFLLFVPLESLALSGAQAEYPLWLGLITASSVIVGQLCGAVLLGSYYGTGRFGESAQVSVAVAITVVVLAVPAISFWGLTGAYATLMFASIAPPLALAHGMFRGGRLAVPKVLVDKDAIRRAVTQFQVSLPSSATIAVGAAVSWLCTIYFVRRSFGVEGVGLVALAMQWQALMMVAEGSWGGVSLKILAEAVASGSPSAARKATLGLLKKNVLATLVVSSIVVIGADWIASIYGLGNRGLELLIRLSAACAVVGACNNIFQRLLLCLDRQRVWFLISIVRLLIQLSITVAFIEIGLYVVVVGVLAGVVVQVLFCALGFNKIVTGALARISTHRNLP